MSNVTPFRAISKTITQHTLDLLSKLSLEDLKAIVLLNQETLRNHLSACRKQEGELRRRIATLQSEVERDKETAQTTIVRLMNGTYATVEEIVAEPELHFAHKKCDLCDEREEHGHEEGR